MNCPRCRAHVVDNVIYLEDTADGLYAVTDDPVADYIHECPCGADVFVASSRAVQHHPGQLRLVALPACGSQGQTGKTFLGAGTPDPQAVSGSVESHQWDSTQGGAA